MVTKSQSLLTSRRKELMNKASEKILKELTEAQEVKALKSKKLTDSPIFWCVLAIARMYLAVVQTGYIHPDEFFQSVEVMAHDVLEIDGTKPWEYLDSSPIRSVIFSGFVSLPYVIIKYAAPYLKGVVGIELMTPKILIITPRLLMTIMSFICDFCVFKIASLCYVRPWQCVEVFAGSYVMLVYATRTFSNSLELILFSVLLWRVCLSMVESTKMIRRENVLQDLYECADVVVDKVKIVRFKKNLSSYNFTDSFIISVIVTIGVFVRPSFLLFSFVPLAYWLQRGVVTKEVSFSLFNWRCLSLLPGVCLTVLSCVLSDSFYYGTMNFKSIVYGNLSAASFTLTPFNFILYNANSKNLAKHGLHSHIFHFAVNIPLLHGVLGLVGLWSVSRYMSSLVFRQMVAKPKVYSMATMLLCSFIFPVVGLSFFAHQEARFLLPTLVPLVILHSEKLSIYALPKFKFSKHFLFVLWHLGNIVFVLIFGFLHQGGVIRSVEFVHNFIATQPNSSSFHVFFTHMYSPPTFLLMRRIPVVRETEYGKRFRVARNVIVHDLGSSLSAEAIMRSIVKAKFGNNSDTSALPSPDVLLCVTGSFSDELIKATPRNVTLKRIRKVSGHFSIEHFPNLFVQDKEITEQCDKSCIIAERVKQFTVDVFQLKVREKYTTAPQSKRSAVKEKDKSPHSEL